MNEISIFAIMQTSFGTANPLFFRLLILLLLLLASLALNLCIGDVSLTPAQAWAALTEHSAASTDPGSMVIWQIRLPRILIALAVGVGLAISGYILQALSRNNLADPYLTGVSSGAGLAVALASLINMDISLIPVAAFGGALLASTLVAVMSRSPSGLSITKLLLSGVALSAICGSLMTLALVSSGDPAKTQGIFFWLAGGIAGRSWPELQTASIYIICGALIAMVFSKPLRLLSLGAAPAASLGLDVAKAQWSLLFAAVLLCGASVSVSGLVGFVGLVAPHIARNIFGRDERLHLVASAMLGGVLVLFSDLVARTAGGGQELPLGTLLALLGGPFFLWLVVRQRSEGL
jgi:iron complex transport system permease protein